MKNQFIMLSLGLFLLGACGNGNNRKEDTVKTTDTLPDNSPKENLTYCNSRFGYCIDYPGDLSPEFESTNGDGRRFTDEKGDEQMAAWGSIDVNESGIEADYGISINPDPTDIPSLEIERKSLDKDSYEIEGKLGERLYFRRTFLKDGVLVSASCQAANWDKERYYLLMGLIRSSLKKENPGYQ
jgi:hypothetical protein